MQLKPEKKRLPWEDDYNPKNRIFKFNIIYLYSTVHGYKVLVAQSSKQRFPTIEDSRILSHNKRVCQHFTKNQLPLSIFQQANICSHLP